MKKCIIFIFSLALFSCHENKSELEQISDSIDDNIKKAKELSSKRHYPDTINSKLEQNQKEKEDLEYLQQVMESSK